MKKLLVYLKDYIKESIIAPLFKLLEASFELIVPLVMAAIIDGGIGQGDKGYIYKMSAVLVALAAVGFICAVVAPNCVPHKYAIIFPRFCFLYAMR